MSDVPLPDESEREPDGHFVRGLSVVGAILLAAAVTLAFVQIVLRFGFNSPQAWAEEVGRYLFVWITFLGAAVAVAHDSHIRVDMLVLRLSKRSQGRLDIFRHVIDAVCIGFLFVSGAIVAWKNRASVFYTIDYAPQVVFYLAVPVGCALMLVLLVRHFRPKGDK